ncbi:type VII secretion-associated serine protease mycosin [Mycolicibacterium palauense]|uniref:type VII secretion-associated serine protease mycosin n=1 Tax=Mycolicibacterium palauense TaxID=2034511 RepID=UPI000BFEC88D|nr:type VII secretion-associated serine protease mycosin [Mycolicibacterium palauense]
MIRLVARGLAAGVAIGLVASSAPAAWAISPPVLDPAAQPPAGSTGPAVPMAQRGECLTTALMPDTDVAAVPANQRMLDLSGAWRFTRGEGQIVAVIDTGVTPGPRLPEVRPGGDYVADTGGLVDCDGHGTAIAGIIAGQPGDDGFSGVAPGAQLISLRQTSAMYAPRTPGENGADQRAAVEVAALARAVVRAADLGARVINISTVTCLPADNTVDQTELGAALRYAVEDKDVVVVAAAGNTGPAGLAGGAACQSNPLGTPGEDPRNWAGVSSVSTPSWWQPYVLSVGSLTPTGQPSSFSMAGPWLGIAAPGERVLSVSNAGDGALADALPAEVGGQRRLISLDGTSYAAAYVSGVAALVRSRFPELTARQVIERLTATAHSGAQAPSNVVGAGTLDPVAALTWRLPPADGPGDPARIAAPDPSPPRDRTPLVVAVTGTAVLVLAVIAAAFAAHRRKETSE